MISINIKSLSIMSVLITQMCKVSSMIEYQEILSKIADIDFVYVSVGGKVNESYVSRFCHSNSTRIRHCTNSSKHLVPNLLKHRENKKILIISLDQYKSEENYRMNHNLVKQSLEECMNFIFFDCFCNKTFLDEFLTVTIEFLKLKTVLSNNFMICNYVKFMNEPNSIETKSEDEIPKIIYGFLQLENNTTYHDRFYEWYGYNYYTYNLIYNYKLYNKISHLHDLRMLFQKFMKTIFTFNDDYDLITITKKSKCWNNAIDITSYIHSTDSMSLSLMQQYDQMYEQSNFSLVSSAEMSL